ncbi:MAG: hypothetical protein P9X24_08805 [Candidatus Hatepunaea meridiana]|nr:hypothetical protein [Candidatus Hatepunaea meridiana]
MIHKSFTYIILGIVIVVILNSCIEHTFNISVLPESGIKVTYYAKGDPMDFDDDGQLLPDSTLWNVKTWIEEKDDENIYHVDASVTFDNYSDLDTLLNWQRNEMDTLHLDHDFSLRRVPNLFGVSWRFTGILYSRRFDEQYGDIWEFIPSECRLLEKDEELDKLPSSAIETLEEKYALGIIQWNINRFVKRFDQVWHLAAVHQTGLSDTSAITLSIARTGWEEDLHQYLNNLDVTEPAMLNLNWWSDLKPVFLGRLIDITGPEIVNLFKDISDAIEQDYQISKDIEDDVFHYIIKIPGKITSSNGSDNEKDEIIWEFAGKDLLNEDGVMIASSFELSVWRSALAAFLLILILNVIRRVLRKKRIKD